MTDSKPTDGSESEAAENSAGQQNETDQAPVSVAMIGLGSFGRRTLEALVNFDSAKIVGVADRDGQQAQKVGREMDVPHYTDNRQMLLGTKPTIVFLAIPPMQAMEIMDYCASLGIHVWKEAPLGVILPKPLLLPAV